MTKKRNVRLTRRSYRRKLIMFGVSIFMSLALTATGFAAWVLSKDAQKKAEGTVEIGAVTESIVEITNIEFLRDESDPESVDPAKFVFEPKENDTVGRVRYDGKSQPENLGVKFTWTVKNFEIVGDMFVDFKVPATVYTAIEKGWLTLPMKTGDTTGFELLEKTEEIATKTYKVLRYSINTATLTADGKTADGILEYDVTTNDSAVTQVVFTMKIDFAWGEVFDGKNPSEYYDFNYSNEEGYTGEPAMGTDISYNEVKATLSEFKHTLHGLTYTRDAETGLDETFEALPQNEKDKLYNDNPIDKYYVEINAKVK